MAGYTVFLISTAVTLTLCIAGCGGGSESSLIPRYAILTLLTDLHDDVRETSGLAKVDGRLYTHNDSGGSALLYEINATTGNVVRTIAVNGAYNEDWEDLACDDTYLYIADIGNSLGSRTNLKIYKILKSDLAANDVVNAQEIAFAYADQTTFTYAPLTTPYDAEALIAYNGQLYVFTKNWSDYSSKVYGVPAAAGSYVVAPLGEKTLKVMVTGAAFDEVNGTVALVGYTNPYVIATPFKSMIMLLRGFTGDNFFSGEIESYEIAVSQSTGQVEAILFDRPTELYISAEGTTVQSVTYPAKLYKTEISK